MSVLNSSAALQASTIGGASVYPRPGQRRQAASPSIKLGRRHEARLNYRSWRHERPQSDVEWASGIKTECTVLGGPHHRSLIGGVERSVESDERVYCLSKAEASRERRI